MQKQTVLAALAAFACTAALAQAPANNTARPPSEVNPTASGGVAASAAQNKVDQRAMLAVFRAERDAADKRVKRLTREQEAVYREGDAVFSALNKAAFSSKKKFDKLSEELGWKIAAAKKDLEKANTALAEVQSNLGGGDV